MPGESQGTSTADRAKEQMQEKAQVAQEKLKDASGGMQSRMREQVDQRSTTVGEQVSSSAQALRSTSERLREEGQDGPAKAAERAAQQAERMGSYLKESDADRILNDIEDFGRRQPLAVAAIGMAAGFAASRFLKASSRSRYTQRQDYRGRYATYPGELGSGGVSVPAGPGTARYGESGTS